MTGRAHFVYLCKLYGISIAAFLILRLCFITYHSSSVIRFSFPDFIHCLFTGYVFDSSVVCPLMLSLLLLQSLFESFRMNKNWKIFRLAYNLFIATIFFINTIDIFFYKQFGTRVNLLAEEAGNDPGKILPGIWKMFPVLTTLFLFAVFIFIFLRIHRKIFNASAISAGAPTNFKWSSLTVLLLAAFSFLYYGPPLWTLAEFSSSPVFNQAAMNGAYTLAKSYQQRKIYENDIPAFDYVKEEEALKTLLDSIKAGSESMVPGIVPTLRTLAKSDTVSFRKKNIVIILLESYGTKYIGRMNEGKGFSPMFDTISELGIFCTKFKSNGPRTQNGIMSAVSGFPSVLGVNLQRRKGTSQYSTLGNILLTEGYETKFIHNGHADYDDMDKFMRQGGFEEVFDVNNYSKWRMKNEWGVSDEDLYEKAYEKIWNTGGRPVLSVLLTMSNHGPYDLPDEFREAHPEVQGMTKPQAAFYYSDFALGHFLEKCRQHPQYKNTLFVIIADHGEAYEPTDNECKIFHIPALFLNFSKPNGLFEQPASQCDIPTTIVAELNYKGNYHFIGQNIFSEDYKPFAFCRSYGNHVYLCTDSLMLKYFFETGQADLFLLDKHQYQVPYANAGKQTKNAMIRFTQRYMQSLSAIFRKGKYRVN